MHVINQKKKQKRYVNVPPNNPTPPSAKPMPEPPGLVSGSEHVFKRAKTRILDVQYSNYEQSKASPDSNIRVSCLESHFPRPGEAGGCYSAPSLEDWTGQPKRSRSAQGPIQRSSRFSCKSSSGASRVLGTSLVVVSQVQAPLPKRSQT